MRCVLNIKLPNLYSEYSYLFKKGHACNNSETVVRTAIS